MDVNKYVKSMSSYSKRFEQMNPAEKKDAAEKALKAAGLMSRSGKVKKEIVK